MPLVADTLYVGVVEINADEFHLYTVNITTGL